MVGFHPGSNTDDLCALGQVIQPCLSLSLLASQRVSTLSVLLFMSSLQTNGILHPEELGREHRTR